MDEVCIQAKKLGSLVNRATNPFRTHKGQSVVQAVDHSMLNIPWTFHTFDGQSGTISMLAILRSRV